MQSNWSRAAVLVSVIAIVVSACGGAATSAPTTGGVTQPPSTPAAATPAAATPGAATPGPATPGTSTPATATPGAETPAASPGASPTPRPTTKLVEPSNMPAGATLVRWFCCLGTGDDPRLVNKETAAVNEFNASHTDVQLALEIVPYDLARDALANHIASGDPPDIVGPLGVGGANAFNDQWLDLAPLIQKNNYDLTQFQSGAVDFYKIGDVQTAIPFAIYPSSMFYKRGLFSEIGMAEPPHNYGEKYKLTGAAATYFGQPEGTEVDWNYDTVRKLALLMTVDKAGADATQAGFDPTQITQYGFEPQRDDLRGWGAYFGAGQLMAADGKTVQIPDAWAAAWKWWYDGTYKDHFIMDDATFRLPEYGGGDGSFCSGKVAMELNFLWSKYCLQTAGNDWDLAAVPVYQGQPSAAFNADTFRLMKSTRNQDAAFTALTYIEGGQAAKKLLQAYGGMPARPNQQGAFFDEINADDCCKTVQPPPDWSVAKAGVQYADNPNFEAFMPKYNQSLDILVKYRSKWTTQAGLDMDAEIAALKAELQAAWDQ